MTLPIIIKDSVVSQIDPSVPVKSSGPYKINQIDNESLNNTIKTRKPVTTLDNPIQFEVK